MENVDVILIHFLKIRKKIERLSKTEFKEILSLLQKNPILFLTNSAASKSMKWLYQSHSQTCQSRADNAFLIQFEKNWLQSFPSDFKSYYFGWYIDDIFVLFNSPKNLEAFRHVWTC